MYNSPQWLVDRNICDYSFLVGFYFFQEDESFPEIEDSTIEFSHRSVWNQYFGGVKSADSNNRKNPVKEIYFFGLIDFLSEYGFKKEMESTFKYATASARGNDPNGLSSISPQPYRERFLNFIQSICI